MAAIPLYAVADVTRARREARVLRHKEGRCIEGDLTEQDWESKVKKRFTRFSALKLPAASYVAIDRLDADGNIRQGHRSVLGRLARSGPRPSVLVPARRGISARAASAFTNLDLLVVNAQGMRGQRTLSTLRAALLECVSRTPTLLVASSPSDLTSLLDEETTNQIKVRFMGEYPPLAKVNVFRVGQDRPSGEREFDFAVQGLREKAPVLRELVDLARSAWWALRQALRPSSDEPPELQRFLSTYERALRDVGGDVSLLEGAKVLLLREHQNLELRTERARATVDAILSAPGRSGPLVLVRDEGEGRFLVEALSRELSVDSRTLGELGVQVTGRRGFWPDRPVDSVVAAGYFGARTLDALLACRARELRLVLDPIEARAVWFHADKMAAILFVRCQEVPGILRLFDSGRKSVALFWLRQTRDYVAQLMEFHVRLSRQRPDLSPATEVKLTFEYVQFQLLCKLLAAMIRMMGPVRVRAVAERVADMATHLGEVSEKALASVDEVVPVKVAPN